MRALEVLQMPSRMLILAIFRVCKPGGGRSVFSGRPIVAHVGPETARFGPAVAGSKYRNRCVIGMDLRSCQHMLANRLGQRSRKLAGSAHPAGQCRAIQIDAFAGVDLRLAIKWLVVTVLGDQYVSQKTGATQAALNRPRRSRRLNNTFAACTCERRPHMTNHLPPTNEYRSAQNRLKQVEAGQAVEDATREPMDRMRASARTGRRAPLTLRMAPPSTGRRGLTIFLDIRSASRADCIIPLASRFR